MILDIVHCRYKDHKPSETVVVEKIVTTFKPPSKDRSGAYLNLGSLGLNET